MLHLAGYTNFCGLTCLKSPWAKSVWVPSSLLHRQCSQNWSSTQSLGSGTLSSPSLKKKLAVSNSSVDFFFSKKNISFSPSPKNEGLSGLGVEVYSKTIRLLSNRSIQKSCFYYQHLEPNTFIVSLSLQSFGYWGRQNLITIQTVYPNWTKFRLYRHVLMIFIGRASGPLAESHFWGTMNHCMEILQGINQITSYYVQTWPNSYFYVAAGITWSQKVGKFFVWCLWKMRWHQD